MRFKARSLVSGIRHSVWTPWPAAPAKWTYRAIFRVGEERVGPGDRRRRDAAQLFDPQLAKVVVARDARALPGRGVEAVVDGQRLLLGSTRLMNESGAQPGALLMTAQRLEGERPGLRVLYMSAYTEHAALKLTIAQYLTPGEVSS